MIDYQWGKCYMEKSDYSITLNRSIENYFIFWITIFTKTYYLWHAIHGSKHLMLNEISNHLHNYRFISQNESNNTMLNILQSSCDAINHHFNVTYNFDVIENSYKLYLPNLLRNNGYVEKCQVVHTDYKFGPEIYKQK